MSIGTNLLKPTNILYNRPAGPRTLGQHNPTPTDMQKIRETYQPPYTRVLNNVLHHALLYAPVITAIITIKLLSILRIVHLLL